MQEKILSIGAPEIHKETLQNQNLQTWKTISDNPTNTKSPEAKKEAFKSLKETESPEKSPPNMQQF